jgi:hypothetical protein
MTFRSRRSFIYRTKSRNLFNALALQHTKFATGGNPMSRLGARLQCGVLITVSLGFMFVAKNTAGDSPNSSRLLSAADQVRIIDASRHEQTNRPISIPRPFVQGEIPNFAQASINGTPLLTQCDVKNRWPDGSLKFAIVSFIVPTIQANGSVVVSFSNQTSGNSTGYLTQSEMLSPAYNFDGQIQLSGTFSHSISARSVLTSAGSCSDPGNDVDAGRYLCTFWLKGPIVTAVILEDRTTARGFDVNTDGATGNPLHPIFEAWFYPQNNAVQLGYTLEDSWASTTPTMSARDQTYSLVLTGGDTNPVIKYTNGTFKQITRSRWHKTFWLNQADPLTNLTIDYNWPYLAQTKFLPHWDTNLQITPSLIRAKVTAFTSSSRVLEGCPRCYSGGAGIGNFEKELDAGGAADWHGPLTTWDIIYLISQNPSIYSVMIGNADLGGRIPYFYREADTNAGHGQWFDAPNNTVGTFGRVISINARTEISLDDVTNTVKQCHVDYPADYINFGGSGQDTDGWEADTSHWPNLAYASYLTTGQYAYYEEQMMQSAYAIGDTPGTRPCRGAALTQASLRQGAIGIWFDDGERNQDWIVRENIIGAFIAVDGSPEKTYFLNQIIDNIAVWEGSRGLVCDATALGTGSGHLGLCGGTGQSTYYSYGQTVRGPAGGHYAGTTLGSWTIGFPGLSQAPLNTTGPNTPGAENSHFQNAYSGLVLGWLDDVGYCPHTTGQCQFLGYIANYYLNVALNPAANIFSLADYVYPTLDNSSGQITSWAENNTFYATQTAAWSGCGNMDEDYAAENIAVMSYLYPFTSSQGGYSGATAYNTARTGRGCISFFATTSPKWDITPRETNPPKKSGER